MSAPFHYSSRSEYLSFGFCREHEQAFNIYIPDYIMKLVHKYSVKYVVLANGWNRFGQFGIADQLPKINKKWIRLTRLESLLSSPRNVFINADSVFVINEMQSIYAAGNNMCSRLGMEDQRQRVRIFTEVGNKQQPVICSNGSYNEFHTFVYLLDDNKLYENGLITRASKFRRFEITQESHSWFEIEPFWNNDTKISKIACALRYSLFLMDNGDLYRGGLEPKRIKTNVGDMAAGCEFHVILYQNGEVEANGRIQECDLNAVNKHFESNTIRVKQISAGHEHAAVLSVNNECFTFGRNLRGQFGNGQIGGGYISKTNCVKLSNKEYPTMARCGGFHSLLLTNKNNVYGFGDNQFNQISALIEDEFIATPYLVDKEKELKLNQSEFICDVLAMRHDSLIVIDPSKRVLISKK